MIKKSFMKGDHAGQLEGREKCIRKADGKGISEFKKVNLILDKKLEKIAAQVNL